MGDKKPRKILEANVEEVSLVDRAANLRQILVIKRLEGNKMDSVLKDAEHGKKVFGEIYTGIEEVVKALPEEQISPFFEADLSEITKALPADLSKTINEITGWMKRTASMKGSPGSSIAHLTTFITKAVGGKYPYPKPVEKVEEIPSVEDAKKSLTDDLSKAFTGVLEFIKKAAASQFPYPADVEKAEEYKKEVPTELATALKSIEDFLTKTLEGEYPWSKPEAAADKGTPAQKPAKKADPVEPAEQPLVQVMADGTIIAKGIAVDKSKGFTESRTAALKNAVLETLKVLNEVADEDTRKALTEALKLFEGDSTPAKKNDEPESDPVKEELLKTVAALEKRLKDIEDTRGAAASTEDKPVVKKESGLWDNVL